MRKTLVKSLVGVFLWSLMLVGSALATPILTLSDGINPDVVVIDGQQGDSHLLPGVTMYQGSIGDWGVNVTTGLTKPTIGSVTSPFLDLNSIDVSSSTGGTLTITWFDDNFGPIDSSVTGLLTAIGGTTTGSVSLKSFISLSNDVFGLTEVSVFGPFYGAFPNIAFSGSEFVNSTFEDLVAFALVATIKHGPGVQVSSFDAALNVPEPSVMLLFGTGLFGLVSVSRRMKNKI